MSSPGLVPSLYWTQLGCLISPTPILIPLEKRYNFEICHDWICIHISVIHPPSTSVLSVLKAALNCLSTELSKPNSTYYCVTLIAHCSGQKHVNGLYGNPNLEGFYNSSHMTFPGQNDILKLTHWHPSLFTPISEGNWLELHQTKDILRTTLKYVRLFSSILGNSLWQEVSMPLLFGANSQRHDVVILVSEFLSKVCISIALHLAGQDHGKWTVQALACLRAKLTLTQLHPPSRKGVAKLSCKSEVFDLGWENFQATFPKQQTLLNTELTRKKPWGCC